MSFPSKVKEDVLITCKRYCCYCERYKGRDIEVHHIVQEADGGANDFDNAIPLCFDCHSEIGSYNTHHPKGNRFTPGELKRIRDEFYEKIKSIPRKNKTLSEKDSELLSQFKKAYTELLEYVIEKDFSCDFIRITLHDEIYYLNEEWGKKKYTFDADDLEDLKSDIIYQLTKLLIYISSEYMRLHEGSGNLLFRNDSWEAGCKLRDELQPDTYEIRTEVCKLLERLYAY